MYLLNFELRPSLSCKVPVSFVFPWSSLDRGDLDTAVSPLRPSFHNKLQRYSKTCQLFLAASCPQNAIPGRVSSYPLSVAMASRVDCSVCHLRHVLFVSRRSKASIDWERRSISRVPLAKLSHGKRILLANFLVFWSSCANGNSSGDQVQAFSSLQKVFFHCFYLGKLIIILLEPQLPFKCARSDRHNVSGDHSTFFPERYMSIIPITDRNRLLLIKIDTHQSTNIVINKSRSQNVK